MNKSFRGIHGSKNKSSSASFISLHFNKADEEQLQFSYNEKTENATKNTNEEETTDESSESASAKSLNQDDSDKEDKFSERDENDQSSSNPKSSNSSSRESTPNKDSVVKEYWSKISKRGSSLDSDLGSLDKNPETKEWQLFKEIKGKITKTLEERKSVSKGKEDREPFDCDVDGKWTLLTDQDVDHAPTKTERLSVQLSPAIEAAEVESANDMFENYLDDKLHKAKCEIISSKNASLPTSSHFNLQQPSKKKDPTMTLSTLIAKRCSSIESATIEDKTPENLKFTNIDNPALPKPIVGNLPKSHQIRNWYYFVKMYWNHVIFRMLVVVVALLCVPVPSWISGFVAGAFLSGYLAYCLFKPGKPKEPFVLPDFSHLPPSIIPVAEIEDEPIIYKGWMNELPFDLNYNPDTYHVNCTRSLYIRLDGSYLRVSYPQNNIPRRAMFNEARHDLQFIDQQHYDITGSTVELLPVGLARKRLWSKKYPICLKIPNPKQSVLSSSSKSIPDLSSSVKPRKDSPIKKVFPRINESNEVVLYLFSRTDREKDLWFYRFKTASRLKLLKSHSPSSSPNIAAMDSSSLENKRTKSVDLATLQLCSSFDNDSFEHDEVDSFTDLSMSKQQKFEMYMSHLLAPIHSDRSFSLSFSSREKKDESRAPKVGAASPSSLSWLNVLIGRVFFDVLTEEAWGQLVAEKIQKKLSKLKLPVFLNELIVKDINLGTALPKIHRASEPCIDQRGLWVDIDLSYNGSFQMTLETKLNLLRTKSDSDELHLSDVAREMDTVDHFLKSPVYNSDEEDSAESSSDEDVPLPDIPESSTTDDGSSQIGGSTGKKILRLVDRFAQSTYFQNATKNKYIQKAMKDISNTPLVLTVEVQWLTGTLALNIPPLPTDRLWYGFRTNPHLSIVARPKLGHHVVTLTHVTDWIEKKLVSEFQKILVMPNMDDLILPIMQSDIDLPKP